MSEKTKLELKLEKLEKDENRQFLGTVREDCFMQDLQLRTLRILDEVLTYQQKQDYKNINYFKEEVYDKPKSDVFKLLYSMEMSPTERFRYDEYKNRKHKDVVLTRSSGSTTYTYEVTNVIREFYDTYGQDKKHPVIAGMVAKTIDDSIRMFDRGLDAHLFLKEKHMWGRYSNTDAGKKAQKFLEDMANKYVYMYLEHLRERIPNIPTVKEIRDKEAKEREKKFLETLKKERELAYQNEKRREKERLSKNRKKQNVKNVPKENDGFSM